MSFFSRIADWADENIPYLGSYISNLVEKLEDAIEDAYRDTVNAVNEIKNTVIPNLNSAINLLSSTLSSVMDEVYNTVEPALDALRDELNAAKSRLDKVSSDLEDLLSNFAEKVWDALPQGFKDAVQNCATELISIKNDLARLEDRLSSWISGAPSWFLEQLNKAKSTVEGWIQDAVSDVKEWAENEVNTLKSDLQKAETDLRNDLTTAQKKLSDALSSFEEWVKDRVSAFIDAILSIDEFLASKLAGFILDMLEWFISSFVDDLAHLQYDPETGEVSGTPKNPMSLILIALVEKKKPENPYKSVKGTLGVSDAGGGGSGR